MKPGQFQIKMINELILQVQEKFTQFQTQNQEEQKQTVIEIQEIFTKLQNEVYIYEKYYQQEESYFDDLQQFEDQIERFQAMMDGLHFALEQDDISQQSYSLSDGEEFLQKVSQGDQMIKLMESKANEIKSQLMMVKDVIKEIENEVVEQKEKLLLINFQMKKNLDLFYQVKKSALNLGRQLNKRKSTRFLLLLVFLLNVLVIGFVGYIKIKSVLGTKTQKISVNNDNKEIN